MHAASVLRAANLGGRARLVIGAWVLLSAGAGDPVYGWGGVALGLAFAIYGTIWGKGRKQKA